MAKRVVNYVVLIDDLDGTELARGEGHTIRYGWHGNEYEIDLSDKHANELDTMMGNLVSKSVRVGRMLPNRPHARPRLDAKDETPELPSSSDISNKQKMLADREFRKEIRAWARENGHPGLRGTGRLPAPVREQWDATHPDRPAPDESAGNWR